MNATRFIGRHVRDMLEKGDPRSINNLWTGARLSVKGKVVAGSALGVYGAYSFAQGVNQYEKDYAMSFNYDDRGVQSLPSTRADGMGYTANNGGDKTLGARGDLVFALHNLRHGG